MSGNKGKEGHQERKQCERESLQTQIIDKDSGVCQIVGQLYSDGENNMFITLMEIKAEFTNFIKGIETVNMIL